MILTFFYFFHVLLLILTIIVYLHTKRMLPSFVYSQEFLLLVRVILMGNFIFILYYYAIINQLISIVFLTVSPCLMCLSQENIMVQSFDLNKLKSVFFSSQDNGSSSTSSENINRSSPSPERISRRNSPSPERISRRNSPILDEISRRNSPILDEISRRNSPNSEQASRRNSPSPERLNRSRSSSLGSDDSAFRRPRPRVWGEGNYGISFDQVMEREAINGTPRATIDTSSRIPNPIFRGVNNFGMVPYRDKELAAALVFRGAYIQNSIWHVDQIFDPTYVQQRFLNAIQSESLQPFAGNLADFLQFRAGIQETRFGYPSVHPITSFWLVHYHANNFPERFLSEEWINIRDTDRILPSAMVNRPEAQIIADWGRPIVLFDDNTRRLIIEALRNER